MHLRRISYGRPAALPGPAVWSLAAAFYFVALFHRNSLGVAALDAQRRLGVDAGMLAVVSALQLGLYVAMQVPAGLMADRLGPRRTLAIGLVLMAAGELTFAGAGSLTAAMAGRALVGVGDACIFLNVLRLAHSWFAAERYALLASIAGLTGALGQILTTVPLGASLDVLGWGATFGTTGLLTGALAVACLLLVRDAPRGRAVANTTAEGVRTALRRAWATPATRHGFWVHMGLMGPFVTVTALWGYPFLVRSEGLSPGAARAHLLLTVAAFALAAPALGLAGARPGMLLSFSTALAAAWSATLAWPGAAPAPLLIGTLMLTGACGAAGLLGFDIARAGNAAVRAGAASGLVNLGGFSAAVGADLIIGRLASAGGGIGAALWPVVAIAGVAALMQARRGVAAAGRRAAAMLGS